MNRFAHFALSTGCAAAALIAAPAAAAEDQDPPRLAAVTVEKACLVSEPVTGDAGGDVLAERSDPAASAAAVDKTRGRAHGLTSSPGRSPTR